MSVSEWMALGAFAAILLGLSFLDARLASFVGLSVIGIITLKYLASRSSHGTA